MQKACKLGRRARQTELHELAAAIHKCVKVQAMVQISIIFVLTWMEAHCETISARMRDTS